MVEAASRVSSQGHRSQLEGVPATNMPQAAWSRLSEVENGPAGVLQSFQALIKSSLFGVELVDSFSQLADLGNEPRIIIEQPRNSVSTGSTRCEQFCGFNEAGFEVKGAAHNLRYIKFGAEHAIIRTELNVTSSIMRSA